MASSQDGTSRPGSIYDNPKLRRLLMCRAPVSRRRSPHQLLIAPEAFETGRGQLGVAHCMLDILVPEVGLQAASVDALVGQLVTAGVTQHVWMNREVKLGRHTQPRHQFAEAGRRKG